jgi:hypothetical protein
METGIFVVGALAFVVLAFVLVGGPAMLTDWIRNRRQEAIRRQIVLTDAIHGALGAVAAPVVRKPLVGPWRIQIAVPFSRAVVVGRILAVTRDVFGTFDGAKPNSYRVVLMAGAEPLGGVRNPRVRRAPKQWSGKPAAA